MTNLEVIETLLIERGNSGRAEQNAVRDELVARGLDADYGGIGQAIDMASGGRTYLGTRESAIECMKESLARAENRLTPNGQS